VDYEDTFLISKKQKFPCHAPSRRTTPYIPTLFLLTQIEKFEFTAKKFEKNGGKI